MQGVSQNLRAGCSWMYWGVSQPSRISPLPLFSFSFWVLLYLEIELFFVFCFLLLLPVYVVGNSTLRVQLPGKRLVLLLGPALKPPGRDLDWAWCLPLESSIVARAAGVAFGSSTLYLWLHGTTPFCQSKGLLLGPREEWAWVAFRPLLSEVYFNLEKQNQWGKFVAPKHKSIQK